MAKKLVEAGRFTLVRTVEGLLWEGSGATDQEKAFLEELSLRPAHWPEGTVVVAYEPESISPDEQKRIYGNSVTVEEPK